MGMFYLFRSLISMKLHFVVNERKNISQSVLSAAQKLFYCDKEVFIPDGDSVQNKQTWFKSTTIKFVFIIGYFLTTLHHEVKELSRENYKNLSSLILVQPILVVARSKAWICGRWIAGTVDSNPTGAWISISCERSVSQLGVSATGRSLVQRSPTGSVSL